MLAQALSKKQMQKSTAKKTPAQITTCMLLAHLTAAAFEREEALGDKAKWESLKM